MRCDHPMSDDGDGPSNRADSISETDEVTVAPVDVRLIGNKAYAERENAEKISQGGLYGTLLEDGRLEIDLVELLLLMERGRVHVYDERGSQLETRDIVQRGYSNNPSLWIHYLVYRDLRSRGYAVRQGLGGRIGFRVYARGERPRTASANQLVYVLRDGEPISLQDLDSVTRIASESRKKLVFALIDQNGEVNYYRVAQIELMNKESAS